MDLPRLHCKGVVGAAGFLEAIILCFMNNERIIEQNSVLCNYSQPNKNSFCDIHFKYEDDLLTAKSMRTSRCLSSGE